MKIKDFNKGICEGMIVYRDSESRWDGVKLKVLEVKDADEGEPFELAIKVKYLEVPESVEDDHHVSIGYESKMNELCVRVDKDED